MIHIRIRAITIMWNCRHCPCPFSFAFAIVGFVAFAILRLSAHAILELATLTTTLALDVIELAAATALWAFAASFGVAAVAAVGAVAIIIVIVIVAVRAGAADVVDHALIVDPFHCVMEKSEPTNVT